MCGAFVGVLVGFLVFDCLLVNLMRRRSLDVARSEVFFEILLCPLAKPNPVVSTSDGLHDKFFAELHWRETVHSSLSLLWHLLRGIFGVCTWVVLPRSVVFLKANSLA